MKKLAVMTIAAVMTAVASALTLAEARGKIGTVIADPKAMTEVMKQLSAEDQKAFLAEVNKAISEMPGSNEARAASYLNVNKAALLGAAKGNLTTLVAETFATVPPEALVVLNEEFASTLFNRASDSTKSYTDEQFTSISKALVEKVNERMVGLDDGARRSTFAVLMMIRASNGSPVDLQETLIKTLPEASQNEARNSWIPAAMAANQTKSYEPLLGEASEGVTMSAKAVVQLAGPQYLESLLSDVVEEVPLVWTANDPTTTVAAAPIGDQNINTPVQPVEPIGYQGQKL